MAGDLNVVRSERDIKNWKPNHNKIAGVMDEEIAHLEGWFSSGWVDASRRPRGDEEQGPYTWWSQRGKAFDNNAGWRIDYQVITPALAERARSVAVDRRRLCLALVRPRPARHRVQLIRLSATDCL